MYDSDIKAGITKKDKTYFQQKPMFRVGFQN
jgi:hypothetical protein